MEQNEKAYQDFIEWKNEKGYNDFTSGEVDFAKQFFELLEDYPSLKQKMVAIGTKENIFSKIMWFLKEKNK